MKEMKKMGRTLGNSSFSKMLNDSSNERVFTLKSGVEARFVLKRVLHNEIDKRTYVDSTINGRDQAFITPESVSDISRTINLQQFFPAIGREVNGRIEVLDGSRRRAACLYSNAAFEVLVTSDDLTLSDARQLATDIQTAREHTLRELGKRLKVMYPAGTSQADIAHAEGLSAAKVTRAFQAAEVPDDMIAVFPELGDLSISDYQTLLDIAEKTKARGASLDDLIEAVLERIEKDTADEQDGVTAKAKIIGYFRAENAEVKAKPVKNILTEKLASFKDKKQFARKKSDSIKRLVTYEFSRLPASYQAELDAAIRTIMHKMQEESE
ncbi:ParB family protein [Pantoea coffeiphila]|nr:ParB family protein [Pantoea coffeiphila]